MSQDSSPAATTTQNTTTAAYTSITTAHRIYFKQLLLNCSYTYFHTYINK